MAIVDAIAAVEGVSPMALSPLSESIDLEAVDRLFDRPRNGSPRGMILRFTTNGWNVFVRDDGVIRVCDPDQVTPEAPAFEKSIAE